MRFVQRIGTVFMVMALGWTLLAGILAYVNYRQIFTEGWIIALNNARDTFNRDLVYRRWATEHGGVYVPVTESTPPNPYLTKVPERDVTTTSGKHLTLVNPAYMTRQVHELGAKQYGIKGHITSLNPIRPANSPDEWEKKALQLFEERKETEVYSLELINDTPYVRLMRPMVTETGCLRCHVVQGYKVGDIRGGISVTVPWMPIQNSISSQTTVLALTYSLIWLVGLCGIGYTAYNVQIQFTRRRKVESDLQERNEELKRANQERENILSVISHDLRSPFNAILGISGILAEDALLLRPPEVQKMSLSLQQSANNVYRLLQNLLEWSVLQKGLSIFKPVHFPVKQAVEESLEMVMDMAANKQISILIDIPQDLEIYADTQMFNSIIRNFTINAIKFTGKGGRIEISGEITGDRAVSLMIRDNGIGMSRAIQEKLFLFSSDKIRKGTSGESSSGFGLIISKEFMDKHGGSIRVESEEQQGTSFYLTFPHRG